MMYCKLIGGYRMAVSSAAVSYDPFDVKYYTHAQNSPASAGFQFSIRFDFLRCFFVPA